jgi:3-methylcrotonyl-CoA carboxylase alpha subunit
MIESLLIANRGEIARRIIRTARRLGVRTIAVYSQADADLPFVREADQAVCIGPAAARESYLSFDRLLAAARETGAQAIHPGYGFLSENAEFAAAVQAAGLVWVGAPPAAILAMGRKDAAKQRMQQAGVPVTPGYLGEDQTPVRLQREADTIGYPVLIKAVAGGGGKGMRKVDGAADFLAALDSCRREAAAAFGDQRVLLEKYVSNPRHIEVQVFADQHGNYVHLFERDCSLQRRHQKVIEEAPAPGMDAATRDVLCAAALRAARAVDYVGAGTIEFIADGSQGLHPDRIWFMEMNTRLQVEHPVTEAITGQDLVEWQLRVAAGEVLPCRQQQLSINGWAIEARLYAENPATGFLPSTGPLQRLRLPAAIRVDSGVEEGGEVSSFYDPMIAKLIAHAPSRTAAAQQLAAACAQIEVWPVRTNAALLVRAAAHPQFVGGQVDTGFIARHLQDLLPPNEPTPALLQDIASALLPTVGDDPWTALRGFRVNAATARAAQVQVADTLFECQWHDGPAPALVAVGEDMLLFANGQGWLVALPSIRQASAAMAAGDGAVIAPMPGRIVAVEVAEGAHVQRGQKLLVLEAMKMEQTLQAPFAGKVSQLAVQAGDQISEGKVLLLIEQEGED